ncbi:MAG: sialate O-acetylesterase [Planctomycetaceae bacterium]|nr:sialate O-acetylesterase [Planctomycetaceae bacterium]
MNRLLVSACLSLLICCSSVVSAELSVASLFSDHMVMQRGQPFKIWGWAEPGTQVSVTINAESVSATASATGRWSATVDPPATAGPHTMKVSSDESSIEIADILVGEVWLCSGQSNMAMTVNRAKDYEAERGTADLPQIRMFKVSSGHALTPQDKCAGTWTVCSPDTVGGFSATAYFFGRRLHKDLDVPIGLINSSVGGTSVESWTSLSAQSKVAAIRPRLEAWQQSDGEFDEQKAQAAFAKAMQRWTKNAKAARDAGNKPPRKPKLAARPRQDRNYPSNLFNGKIHPLIGFSIRGAVWYQGENSSGRGFAHLYGRQLTTLIRDWRQRWASDFPFAWVQLPNYRAAQKEPVETNGWTLVQEGMLKTLDEPATGMAITLDVGEARDIHPKDKQSVGFRLAQWALASVYGADLIPMGPVYREHAITDGRVTIAFDHAQGLTSATDTVKGFAICGADRKFVWADARIDGDKVIVSSPDVPQPVSVRYAWAANPIFSLYNEAGIPASPFRTDDWDEQGQ